MEIVYVRIFPVYVRSFPTSSAFTQIWVPCIFDQLPGFQTIYHLFSCCRVQRWQNASKKPGTCMYNSCKITTMAYETWACKNRPYLPGLTLLASELSQGLIFWGPCIHRIGPNLRIGPNHRIGPEIGLFLC